jgi:hypothetical protein
MALSVRSRRLQHVDLTDQFSQLEQELSVLKGQYSGLKVEYGEKAAQALTEAVLSLRNVIQYVNKADNHLRYWYEKGNGLKLVLRCVGVDKRVGTLVKVETTKVKKQALKSQAQFDSAGEVVDEGLHVMQEMNRTVTRFSLTSVGVAQRRANESFNEIEQDVRSTQRAINSARSDQQSAQIEIRAIPNQIRDAQSTRRNAQNRKEKDRAVCFLQTAMVGEFSV